MMGRVREYMDTEHKDNPFTEDEIQAAIQQMTDDNKVMLTDEMLFIM